MAIYRISGVWLDSNQIVTDYAFHTVYVKSISKARKIPKAQAIALLEIRGNSATTLVWNYARANWTVGENVQVVNGITGNYLCSNPRNRLTDNLGHLIHFDWMIGQ